MKFKNIQIYPYEIQVYPYEFKYIHTDSKNIKRIQPNAL